MCISDVFKSSGSGFSIVGRVETGQLRVGDKVLVQPQGEIALIKSEYFLKILKCEITFVVVPQVLK